MPRLSHVNVTMPPGREAEARAFYAGLLGLAEVPKPELLRARGGCWFDAGGLDVHVSADAAHVAGAESRHFGLEVEDVDALRARLDAAGVRTEDGRSAPWKRFFTRDPFGNRIEVHAVGGLRGA